MGNSGSSRNSQGETEFPVRRPRSFPPSSPPPSIAFAFFEDDFEQKSDPDKKDELYNAITKKNWSKARSLLSESDVSEQMNYSDCYGCNVLHMACSCGAPADLLKSLLDASTNAPMKQDNNGATPVYRAINPFLADAMNFSSDSIILMIIDACPRAVCKSTNYDVTPLHNAIEYNKSMEIIKRLLAAHPDAVAVANKKGETPLDYFFHEWNVGLRSSLRYAEPDKESIAESYVHGECYGSWKTIREIYDITNLLFKARFDGTIESNGTPTSFGFLRSCISIPQCPWSYVNLVLKFHPEQAVQRDPDGNFPLQIACGLESSNDGKLYKCRRCESKIKKGTWFVHKKYRFNFCHKCFLLEKKDENHFLMMHPVDKIPAVVRDLIAINREIASFPNHEGRLPLHLAIERGNSYEGRGCLKLLFKASPQTVSTRDIQTHMYPFMLTAVKYDSETREDEKKPSEEHLKKFTSCFALLMENPVLVSSGIFQMKDEQMEDDEIKLEITAK